MKTPIYAGRLQSDLDFAGFNPLNLTGWPPSGGGGSGTGLPAGWVNVKDPPYNAKGDNVHDDTVAIQTAMNDLIGAAGTTLFFPNGAYLCNGNWDATTNSILKFPYLDPSGGLSRVVTLQGELNSWGYAALRSTRTDGTGSYPALIAAYACQGTPADELTTPYFNGLRCVIKNMALLVPAYSTSCAVRLDTAAFANVEDVLIVAEGLGATEPGNDTVGLWMPDGGNFGLSNAINVSIQGFRNGLFISEHFIGRNIFVTACKVGLGLLTGYQSAQLNLNSLWNQIAIQQRGIHLPVDIHARIEDADMRTGSGAQPWQAMVLNIDDASNTIWGTINYIRVHEPERMHGDIVLSGAANLRLFNMYTASANWGRNSASTVAALPASPVLGQQATVSDGASSLAWGATVTGGGTTKYLVGFNGTNWTVVGK